MKFRRSWAAVSLVAATAFTSLADLPTKKVLTLGAAKSDSGNTLREDEEITKAGAAVTAAAIQGGSK